MSLFRSPRIARAILQHRFNAELRWVTRRPLGFLQWKLLSDTSAWSTFDQHHNKDKAITKVTTHGRTFWVEASRGDSSDGIWLIIIGFILVATVVGSPLGLLLLFMGIIAPTETTLVFHTVDPREHGRDPYTMKTVGSHKDFKRALEMRQPKVLSDI